MAISLLTQGWIELRLMAIVVLDVEADLGGGEGEQHGGQHRLPGGLREEHQVYIREGEDRQDDGGLHVHARAIPFLHATLADESLHAAAQLTLEPGILFELEALV